MFISKENKLFFPSSMFGTELSSKTKHRSFNQNESLRRFSLFDALHIFNVSYHGLTQNTLYKQIIQFIQCLLTHINCLFSHFMIEILDKFLFGVVQKSICISDIANIFPLRKTAVLLTVTCCLIVFYFAQSVRSIDKYSETKAACFVCCFTT